jgi:hypothetical protein
MPELPYRNSPFIDRVKEERSEGLSARNVRHVKSERLKELADEFHERVLGGGSECFVVPKKGDETKVVAEDDIRYSLRHASELWERLFGEKIALDPNTANFLLTEEWEQFYVDRMLLTYTFWTPERKAILLKHMQESSYSQDDIDRVMRAVDQFDALA